jgi:hypothetical protein
MTTSIKRQTTCGGLGVVKVAIECGEMGTVIVGFCEIVPTDAKDNARH